MKNCNSCRFANWKRTPGGKLHPSGDGKCSRVYEVPPLPASMYWIGGAPTPAGGYINRREDLKEHCVYFARAIA